MPEASTETKPDTSATEGKNIDGAAPGAGTQAATTEAPKEPTFLQADIDRIVNKRLAEQKKAIEKASEEAKAAEQGEWKTLADTRATELATEKATVETLKQSIATLEKRLHAIADERAKQLPEKLQARVPAADKATAEERFQELDRIADVLADVPHVAVTPGNGAMPKPAGPPGGKEAEAAARADQARLYSQF